ncbi:MAG: hypothetical protein OXU68_04115 [Bacteroidota bacterium]|nr:hypothetical protein [Bacteroidota bacterium]
MSEGTHPLESEHHEVPAQTRPRLYRKSGHLRLIGLIRRHLGEEAIRMTNHSGGG